MKKALVWFYNEDPPEVQRRDDSGILIGRVFMVLKYDSYVAVTRKLG